jgi:hypothetical protein
MRIKIRRASKDLGCNLIFLQRRPRVPDGMVAEISQELAERLRAVESMAVDQLLNLEKARLYDGYVTCHTHLTESNKRA